VFHKLAAQKKSGIEDACCLDPAETRGVASGRVQSGSRVFRLIVGRDETVIPEYIKNQEAEDNRFIETGAASATAALSGSYPRGRSDL
jgi:hypothetical protein